VVGRFVSADVVVPRELNTQSWNRFSYCSGNPVIYKDPTGHYEIKVDVSEDRDHAGTLTLYDDYGNKVNSYEALSRGSNKFKTDSDNNYVKDEDGNKILEYSHKEREKWGTDTPTGKYKISGKFNINEKDPAYRKYGSGGLKLKGVEGEAGEIYKSKKRSGICIHGGDKRSGKLKPTHGCIRLDNNNIKSLMKEINTIEQKREKGLTGFLYNVRNILYRIFGKETRDVVEVYEK